MPPDAHIEENLTTELLLQREQTIWQMRVHGYSQARIAQELGLDQSTVSRVLKRVRDRLAEDQANSSAQMRLDQTDQLLHIFTEALESWEESKKGSSKAIPVPSSPSHLERERKKPGSERNRADGPQGEPEEESLKGGKKAGKLGNHVYLRVALQALTAIRQLWGLNAPGKADAPAPPQYVERILSPEMERVRNELRRMRDHGLPTA